MTRAWIPRLAGWVPVLCLLLWLAGCGGSSDDGFTVTLSATHVAVSAGQSTELHWYSSGSPVVESSNFGAVSASGKVTVTPAATTTYTLTVREGEARATASVTITLAPAPPAPVAGATASEPFFVPTDNYFLSQSTPFLYANQFADVHYPLPIAYAVGNAPAGFVLPAESERSVRAWAQADPRITVVSGVPVGSERVKVFLVPTIQFGTQQNIIGLTRYYPGSVPYYEVYVSTQDPQTKDLRSLSEIRKTLAHELGHVWGLGHSPDSRDLMYYRTTTQQGTTPETFLTLGDALTLWTTLTNRLIVWVPTRPPVSFGGAGVQALPADRARLRAEDGVVVCVYPR